MEPDRPLSSPGPTPGFSPFAARFGRLMRYGLAVTALLDLGPTEVFRGTTARKQNTTCAVKSSTNRRIPINYELFIKGILYKV